ncbi:MAG TPA: DUF3617 family protein [Allosphingosinicella sp.]|jgi:hypothetical protein
MKYLLTAGTALLLVACGSQSSTLQPGQWEMTTKMTEVEAPGMPEAALAQMRTAMASQTQTRSDCMTQEEANNPAGNIVNAGTQSGGCNFTESTFAGGNINVRGTCTGPGGPGSMQMAITGTYTQTEINGRISTEMQAPAGMPGGAQSIRVSGTLTGRRTGECAAS